MKNQDFNALLNKELNEAYQTIMDLVLKFAPYKEPFMGSYSRLFYAGTALWYLLNDTPEDQRCKKTWLLTSDLDNTLAHLQVDSWTANRQRHAAEDEAGKCIGVSAEEEILDAVAYKISGMSGRIKTYAAAKWGAEWHEWDDDWSDDDDD